MSKKKTGKKKSSKKSVKKAGKKKSTGKPAAPAPKKTGKTKGSPFMFDVPVDLTPAERLERAESMTLQMRKRDAMMGRFDLERKEHNAKLKEKEAEIDELRKAFEEESETRRVKCRWLHDWSKGEKVLVRLDTKPPEVVKTETITAAERQLDLGKAAEKNARAAKKASGKKPAKGVGKPSGNVKGTDTPLTASIAERAAAAKKADAKAGKGGKG